jgi:hypothetical protein
LEEFKAERGKVKTLNLSTYLIPTALDCPEMTSLAVEIPEPTGPFGLKGAGEISIDGPLPAVANALAEACGVRIRQTPLTAERVLGALREKKDGSGKMEEGRKKGVGRDRLARRLLESAEERRVINSLSLRAKRSNLPGRASEI